MDFAQRNTINKLLLLFVFDKMDIILEEATVFDICYMQNDWLSYLDTVEALYELVDAEFLTKTIREKSKCYFELTPGGRMCIAEFYTHVPASIRQAISDFVKGNRMEYKRKQEYFKTYKKNEDGSYTVWLKISNPFSTSLEIKLTVPTRHNAKQACARWADLAASTYCTLLEQLVE